MATFDRFSGLLKKKDAEAADLDNVATQDLADLAAASLAPEPQAVGESFADSRQPGSADAPRAASIISSSSMRCSCVGGTSGWMM